MKALPISNGTPAPSHWEMVQLSSPIGREHMTRPMAIQLDRINSPRLDNIIKYCVGEKLSQFEIEKLAVDIRTFVFRETRGHPIYDESTPEGQNLADISALR